MTSEIRQPGSSYPASFLEQMRKELRKPDGSAKTLTQRHGVNRTTAHGWEKKVKAKIPLMCKGSPRKLGPFEETEYFKLLLNAPGFQDPKTMMNPTSGSVESMSKSTAERNLRRWGIVANAEMRPVPNQSNRTLHLWRLEWKQPENTVQGGETALQGILWLLVTGKGLKGFMLTADDAGDTLGKVATAALEKLKGRKRQLRTNHSGLAEVNLPGWRILLV